MPHKLSFAVLLTLFLSIAAEAMAQRLGLEVDPLLIDDLKGGRASSLKLVEVEFRVITIDLDRARSRDMDRVRTLFGIAKSDAPGRNNLAVSYGLVSSARTKLSPAKAEGAIKHQVLETGPFEKLLSWMTARSVASTIEQSSRKVALGSTVVVLDQRVSVPRLKARTDARTGEEIQKVEFIQSGLHLELTPLSQVFPLQKELGEAWQLRLDRVMTSRLDGPEQKQIFDRAQHRVTVAVGQTALIPSFVQTDRPAFVLLSVKTPAPKPDPLLLTTILTPAGEVVRLSSEPDGPGLADRIRKTLTATPDSPTPRLYKPGQAKPGESIPNLRLVGEVPVAPPARVASKDPIPVAAPDLKFAGVTLREFKESEIPLRNGVPTLELYELERVLLLFPEKLSALTTSEGYAGLFEIDAPGPNDLIIQAKSKGVGTLQVVKGKDAAGKQNAVRIEIVVRGDTRNLARTLQKLFPDEDIELTEAQGAIILRGEIADEAAALQVVEIADQFYPMVLNQLSMRTPKTGRAESAPGGKPVGNEIRALRSDVQLLREDIRRLIKVMEGQLEPGAKLDEAASLPSI